VVVVVSAVAVEMVVMFGIVVGLVDVVFLIAVTDLVGVVVAVVVAVVVLQPPPHQHLQDP
jgi:hypothetical protein